MLLVLMPFVVALDVNGGGATWIAADVPTLSNAGLSNAGGGKGAATTATRSVKLPERLSAAELKRMMMDLPGTFEIVDLRPPAHFADFSLPGSKNAAIADVIADHAYLGGTDPLVIVDRDGTLAMAVGGILSQKTQRTIKVLFGGLEAYWNESGALMPPASPPSTAGPDGKPSSPAPGPAVPAAPAPAAPESPKKKSAGC
jgi:rhodanese-related sulfurtransferase